MLVFTIGRVDLWFHSIQLLLIILQWNPFLTYSCGCLGLEMFFFKTPLLLCTIKYFISLTCIDLKNSLNESMLFNFFLKKSQLGFESIENINIQKIMTLLVISFFLALKYKFSHIEVPEENELLVLIIYSLF